MPQIRPQQRRHHDADHNQNAAHRRRARFFLMRLRTVFADMLADLKFAQLADQPRSKRNAKEQRRETREHRARRHVAENVESASRPDTVVRREASRAWDYFLVSPKARSRAFSTCTPREPLNRTASPGCARSPDKIPGLFRRVEKKRGAVRHPAFHGLVDHEAGSAAYADNGMNTLLRGESSNAAVQGLGLSAKLEHFAQHGNAPPGGSIPEAVPAWSAWLRGLRCSNR